jgi:molybdopterin-guanine dinucleotide biosynthesis protein A
MNRIDFFVNIQKNSLLIKGNIPSELGTYEAIGGLFNSLSKLNKDLEIVILFDMPKVPFIFILYLNKIQKTIKKEENKELFFTVVTKDKDLLNFLNEFKENTNPLNDIMDILGAGNTNLNNINLPDILEEKGNFDNLKEHIQNVNNINNQDLDEDDLNLELLNKIKFIYEP